MITARSMFRGATLFDQNLDSWDTSSLTDASGMFAGALAFSGRLFLANDLQLFDQSTFFDTACNPFDMGEPQTSTTIGPTVVGVFNCPIPEGAEFERITVLPIQGTVRYVKVQRFGGGLALGEVQVFAMVNGVETNVALDGTATQISTYIDSTADTFGPEKCNNGVTGGDRSNICHTNSGEQDQWWKVELASLYDITRVVLWNRQYCCTQSLSGVFVYLLDDSEGVVEQFKTGDSTGVHKFEFPVTSQSVSFSYYLYCYYAFVGYYLYQIYDIHDVHNSIISHSIVCC